jgi:hypothetical protein
MARCSSLVSLLPSPPVSALSPSSRCLLLTRGLSPFNYPSHDVDVVYSVPTFSLLRPVPCRQQARTPCHRCTSALPCLHIPSGGRTRPNDQCRLRRSRRPRAKKSETLNGCGRRRRRRRTVLWPRSPSSPSVASVPVLRQGWEQLQRRLAASPAHRGARGAPIRRACSRSLLSPESANGQEVAARGPCWGRDERHPPSRVE